jgi:hypothetical protein
VGRGLGYFPSWYWLSHDAGGREAVGPDFFGINVASAEDPRCDDYVVDQLRAININHLRLCWDVDSQNDFRKRFLDRLLDEGFDVMVALIPTFSDAQQLETDSPSQERWREFVGSFLGEYGDRIALVEIGNTPNRPKWSGHTLLGYNKAWEIAFQEAARFEQKLAGPNVSDFEPLFNVGYLRNMRATAARPAVHTTNLFVERAVEPERYDPRALGKRLAGTARLNLAKKISVLSDISQRHGVERTYSTYACWTSKRLRRWSTAPEVKGADYLVRYLVICAATEGLDRVYWGPLIDQRDGLIDCGHDTYPDQDNVAHYKTVRGSVDAFRPLPTFEAFKFVTTLLRGNACDQGVGKIDGVNHYIFSDAEQEHHIIWALDGGAFQLDGLYPSTMNPAQLRDIFGQNLEDSQGSAHITETPIVLTWPDKSKAYRPSPQAIRRCESVGPAGTVHLPQTKWKTMPICEEHWQGVMQVSPQGDHESLLTPDLLHAAPVLKTLRDKRNKLWTIEHPGYSEPLVVKQNRARGIKRLSYFFRESKGKRHWNTATEMLRRGINTPQPIGFAERKRFSGIADNYYVAAYLPGSFSTRDLFTAFANGEDTYRGLHKHEWLTHVARFVAQMHDQKIIHRDLSSGNLLITMKEGEPTIYVIDIGRAQIDKKRSVSLDIKRICYKLDWPDREYLVTQYQSAVTKNSLKFWRASVYSYDLKLILKRRLKGIIRKQTKAVTSHALIVSEMLEPLTFL